MSLLLALIGGGGASTVQASGPSISRSLAVGALTGVLALSGVSIPRTTTAGAMSGSAPLSGPSIARTTATGATTGTGALSGPSIARTTATGPITGAATLSGPSIARTTSGGDLQALADGSISGVGITHTLALGDLFDLTPQAPSVGGSNAGGGGGWHQGENARFNLKGSPGFDFSTKKGKKFKKVLEPTVPAVSGELVSAQPKIAEVIRQIDDDELAIMLLLGARVDFPSQPGVDDDDEAIWVLLQ